MTVRDIKSVATAEAVFASWISRFSAVVEARDAGAFAAQFTSDGFWRDILSFTWEHRTFGGTDQIRAAFAASAGRVAPRNIRIAADRSPPRVVRRSGRSLVEGYLDFETDVGAGVGFVRITLNEADPFNPRIWLLLTSLYSIRGFEEKTGRNRPSGDEFSQIVSPVSWRELRERERAFADRDPQVLIIGAGQGGLILAARLKQMGVDALVVDRSARIGDVWRERYNNLTLHNESFANHFPYLEYPTTWPVWLPKDMLAGWVESYAEFLELNVWTSCEALDPAYDPVRRDWSVSIKRGDGTLRAMRCKHIVMATGVSGGAPKKPALPGLADFKGTVVHSAEFQSGVDWAGKNALVVGTGNSGHDVAQDLYVSKAASVAIMQRGATCVASLDPSAKISYAIYDEGRSVEDADLMAVSVPYPILEDTYKWVTKRTKELDADLINKLHEVGFKTHNGEDETGFQMMYLRGAGGYYIDVGCCDLIIRKEIDLVHADQTDHFVANGLKMKDGTVRPLDLVVLATGFSGLEESIRTVFGEAVAKRVGPVWGFDQDYVMRNMWRRTAQDGLWLMGGAIIEARLYSRYLALEIKASLEGLLPEKSAMPLVPRSA